MRKKGSYRKNKLFCLLAATALRFVQSYLNDIAFEGHSKKPDETRRRIVELLGDVPRLELFARDRAPGWDAWGNEAPPEE